MQIDRARWLEIDAHISNKLRVAERPGKLRTLFMFSSDADKSARVLSPQTIKSYLKQGWLKPLESVPLTKRVAKRVIGEFERSAKRAEELAVRIGAKAEEKPA